MKFNIGDKAIFNGPVTRNAICTIYNIGFFAYIIIFDNNPGHKYIARHNELTKLNTSIR